MIIYLYGPDDFRAKEKIKALKEKFKKDIDLSGSGVFCFDSPKWGIEELKETMGTGSLFARKAMIIIEDALSRKDKDFLVELTEAIKASGDNILIIYEPHLVTDRKGEVKLLDSSDKESVLTVAQKKYHNFLFSTNLIERFDYLTGIDLERWIVNQVNEAGAKISAPAAKILAQSYAKNLWLLTNEIKKLAAYALAAQDGGGIITVESIKLLTIVKAETIIFTLTDAVGTKNKPLAIASFEALLADNIQPVYLMSMIFNHFRNILAVRSYLEKGESSARIASKLGLHSYVVQKAINQSRHYSAAALKNILNELLKLDSDFKNGRIDFKTGFEIILAETIK